MFYTISELRETFNVKPNGVLHVGAHTGEESSSYQENGWGHVIWVEGQPDLARSLRKRLNRQDNTVIESVVWDESGIELDFNIASNGESSSLLDFGNHATSYPHITYSRSIPVFTKRLDEIIPTSLFADFINIDIQGVELRALKGLGARISEFKWIYTEVNKTEVYIGCTRIEDLDFYLAGHGFKRVSTRWVIGKGWGDALYCSQNFEMVITQRLKAASGNLIWNINQIREKLQIWQMVLRVFRKLRSLI